ncbi:hypothetical protein CEXT_107631 [Caerostris extrusa]|uniref:Uncharacterized protein n=1 Tax=Caerostris extrusa TaxID=172846 RepID=A0AAV4TLA0_CAEEX|nr:hypothetical protein CEXT_107631 [Caerostris extrusa]
MMIRTFERICLCTPDNQLTARVHPLRRVRQREPKSAVTRWQHDTRFLLINYADDTWGLPPPPPRYSYELNPASC